MTDQETQIIKDFLKSRKLMVIATASDNKPQAALVGFAEDEDFNIYFETRSTSRKAANMKQNDQVALVIGHNQQEPKTLQLEGKAEIISDEAEVARLKELFVAKDSPAVKFFGQPGVNLHRVTLSWLRFTDYSQGKPQIIEHQF